MTGPRATPDSAPTAPWPGVLDRIVACPKCGSATLALSPEPHCTACDFRSHSEDGIPALLVEDRLHDGHHAEVQAQTAAVQDYYENEDKLTCHWDRISADELPALLGWPSGVGLDLGCGTGTAGGSLKKAGMSVVGVDLSRPCLAAAARRVDAVVQVDAAHLPFADKSFDAVVSRGCLHHLDDAPAALAETARVMKPGARAVFMDPREYSWLEPIKHRLRHADEAFTDDHHAYTPKQYAELIGAHFEIERQICWHPFGILVAHSLDLVPLPTALPRRGLAQGLLSLDRALNHTPLRKVGHLLGVVAKKS